MTASRRTLLGITCLAVLLSIIVSVSAAYARPVPMSKTVALPEDIACTTLPQGVATDWWFTVQEDVRQSEYNITWQEQTALVDLPAAFRAPNRSQNLRTYFTAYGIRVVPRTEPTPGWELGLALTSYGYAGAMQAVDRAGLSAAGNRIDYTRGNIIEWYVNDDNGMEQGFKVTSAPPENANNAGNIALEMEISGNLTARFSDDPEAVEFFTASSVRVLEYGGLLAWDSTGQQLPAFLSVSGSLLTISVDDSAATYPIEIDPTIISPDWTAEDNQASASFGWSVGTAGDVNGDNYSDVIIGAPYYDNGQTDEGRAYVYHGSASGLSATPNWTAESNQDFAHFGYSVSTAGDINDDGYQDVIVGARLYSNGQVAEGGAFVYHGSASGLSITPNWTAESDQDHAHFGTSLGTAGDINGDGYSDVIVGVPDYDNDQTDEGQARVYMGSASGLSASPGWTAEGNQDDAYFGWSVGTAGDVNGDSFSDVIVGAPFYDVVSVYYWPYYYEIEETDAGQAFVYYGSASGPSSTPDWTNDYHESEAHFGFCVSTAGDVDGNGCDEVIVGAPDRDGEQQDEGGCLYYRGTASGLDLEGGLLEIGQVDARFGYSVSTAGDVNNDGFDDTVVGAPYCDDGQTDKGAVFIYCNVRGFVWHPTWVAEGNQNGALFGWSVSTAGDVNGDGRDDFVIGAPYCDGGQTDEGQASLCFGSVIPPPERWTWDGDQTGANLGVSVSTAGDMDGDGFSDIIVGADMYDTYIADGQGDQGTARTYHGSYWGLNGPVWAENGAIESQFGFSVSTAGDVNGNGYDDIIIGSPGYDSGRGLVSLYYGPYGDGWAPTFIGAQEGGGFGYSVASAGDVNGDGYSDVLIGQPFFTNGQAYEGSLYILYGSAAGLSTSQAQMIEGNAAYGFVGVSARGTGDINADGYDDIILGRPYHSLLAPEMKGQAFVFLGSASGLSASPDWSAPSLELPCVGQEMSTVTAITIS